MDTLDADQAAVLLNMNPKRVRALASEGKLPAMRVGRRWLFARDRLERLMSGKEPGAAHPLDGLSARNHLRGRITGLRLDGLMAEVTVDIAGQPLVAIITRASVERLGLAIGDEVRAVVKATEVMVAKS